MIALFLVGELDSARFGDRLRRALVEHQVDKGVVRDADPADAEENRLRRQILTSYRGWGHDESVFGGMPDDVEWMWAELDEHDLQDRVFTISWFFEDAFGTRRPAEIAAFKRKQEEAAANPPGPEGAAPPPILLTDPEFERLVILEGHSRIISYLVNPAVVSFPLRVMLGQSPRVAEWSEW